MPYARHITVGVQVAQDIADRAKQAPEGLKVFFPDSNFAGIRRETRKAASHLQQDFNNLRQQLRKKLIGVEQLRDPVGFDPTLVRTTYDDLTCYRREVDDGVEVVFASAVGLKREFKVFDIASGEEMEV